MSDFEAGDCAALYRAGSWGLPSVHRVTIDRVTATQYVLSNGDRYRKSDLREVGTDRYYSPELVALDDPRLASAAKAQERQRLVNAVSAASDKWARDRRSTPTDLAAAAQALVDYDVEATR